LTLPRLCGIFATGRGGRAGRRSRFVGRVEGMDTTSAAHRGRGFRVSFGPAAEGA